MIYAVIGAIASGCAIAATLATLLAHHFKLTSDVAVLKSQMGQVDPIQIAKDMSWIKGALGMLGRALHVELEGDDV